MITIKNLSDLASAFQGWVNEFEREKARFLERFETNPAYALEWSGAMFSLTPRFEIARDFLQQIATRQAEIDEGKEASSEEEVIRYIRDLALVRTIDRARSPKHSSSPESNLVYQNETAAWSEVLLLFGRPERQFGMR